MPVLRTDLGLRPVRDQDQDFLRLVYAETRRDELAQVEWPPGALELFLRGQFDAQSSHYSQHYPGAEFLIIECSGASCGRLYIHRGPAEIRIMDVALLSASRGQGIGTVLIQEILDEGQASGRIVSLHVEKFNPALRWYERLGFQTVAERGAYWLLHRVPEGQASLAATSAVS